MSNAKVAKNNQNDNVYDDDVHISYQDQSKINSFAINNNKLHELQDELVEKKKELENLNEAIDELVLLDESDVVPFQHGEVFTYLTASDASSELETSKTRLEGEIKSVEAKADAIKKTLSELKTQLYAKFGNKINLEETDAD